MTKYEVKLSSGFKRDYKKMVRQGKDVNKLLAVVEILATTDTVPEQYGDHPLKGKLKGYRDCHIEPDWVLVYKKEADVLVLHLSRTGSHSEVLE